MKPQTKEILIHIWKEFRRDLLVILVTAICMANCKGCKNEVETVIHAQNPYTPLINSFRSVLTKNLTKQKVDSVTRVLALSKIPPAKKSYYYASNKAIIEIKAGICDINTTKQLLRASDSLNIVNATALKADSIRIAGLELAQIGWRNLDAMQEKRHIRDTLIIDSLITKAIPKARRKGFWNGVKVGTPIGAALVGTAVIVKP